MNIKKAADLFDLSPDTLRYYEKQELCRLFIAQHRDFVIIKRAI